MINRLINALSAYKNKTRHVGLMYSEVGGVDVYVCKEFPRSRIFTDIIVEQITEMREEHGVRAEDPVAFAYLAVFGDKMELSVCFCDGGLFRRELTHKHFPVIDKKNNYQVSRYLFDVIDFLKKDKTNTANYLFGQYSGSPYTGACLRLKTYVDIVGEVRKVLAFPSAIHLKPFFYETCGNAIEEKYSNGPNPGGFELELKLETDRSTGKTYLVIYDNGKIIFPVNVDDIEELPIDEDPYFNTTEEDEK